MELKHRLTYNNTPTVIDEPIGFDEMKSTIKRHDYHGMGAEVSLGNLEFYGNAIDIIETAYAADIDSEVMYDVLAGTDVVYSGKLDLSTLSVKQGEYKSVQVKVGEIGAKTTFNNRTDKEVDVDDPKTIDGSTVTAPTWKSLVIPKKSLLYTNKMREKTTRTIDSRETWGNLGSTPDDIEGEFILSTVDVNEYGAVSSDGVLFAKDENFDEKFGTNTRSHLEWNMSLRVSWSETFSIGSYSVYGEVYLHSGSQLIGRCQFEMNSIGRSSTKTLNIYYSARDYANDALILSYRFWQTGDGGRVYSNLKLEILAGANFKMTMYDTLANDGVASKMLMVHDALNVVSHAISENALDVKSDWYEYANTPGGGALKALTNGYKIRGLFTDGVTKRNMPLSFKALIESLSALDNIGWGFSTESGNTYVRVERWDWFYKSNVVLTLKNVAEITTEVLTDRIPTELKIGYKKYATQDQYNSIDSPHGSRTFLNAIKALSQAITKESEFIADNYAIEETRRARTQKNETEESTYDENIFVFELIRSGNDYSIGHTAFNAQKVGKTDEFINAKLTPRHMAARWADYIFATNNSTPFRFTTGEINYQASFAVIPETATDGGVTTYSLRPFVSDPAVAQAENADIANSHAKFKAEKITFTFPISVAQYKSVMTNPYGIVRLTNNADQVIKEGWILDFKYKFEDGTADFTLIAKN